MIKKLFATFTMIILIGCTVIGSQPVLSFKPINRGNLIIFLQDSKNVIFIDTEKEFDKSQHRFTIKTLIKQEKVTTST